MHPMLFEYWWRDESARIQQRAEMAAVLKEAIFGARTSSSRAARLSATLGSGWRRAGRAALVP
jgi:hypothetical protein